MRWIYVDGKESDSANTTRTADAVACYDSSQNLTWTIKGIRLWSLSMRRLGIKIRDISTLRGFYQFREHLIGLDWEDRVAQAQKRATSASNKRERLECEMVEALFSFDDAPASTLIEACGSMDAAQFKQLKLVKQGSNITFGKNS